MDCPGQLLMHGDPAALDAGGYGRPVRINPDKKMLSGRGNSQRLLIVTV
jgi:hypothetical protein